MDREATDILLQAHFPPVAHTLWAPPNYAREEALGMVEWQYNEDTHAHCPLRTYEYMEDMLAALETSGDGDVFFVEMLDVGPEDHHLLMRAIRRVRQSICGRIIRRLEADCPMIEELFDGRENEGYEADTNFIRGVLAAVLAIG